MLSQPAIDDQHSHAAQEYVSKLDEVAGTFAWAAPELLLGRRCSEKVDIFAFGVVLWEIATGERPARGQMREVRCALLHRRHCSTTMFMPRDHDHTMHQQ